MKTRRIYASIASLLQVNLTQLALKIAARDRFIIQRSGYSAQLFTALFLCLFIMKKSVKTLARLKIRHTIATS
ncbi:MAG: hypothetical protein CMK62_09405 [Pseudoalteromonadaceae bacterium]|nr:hypothetical protein [Pseudoalteromonadaceae bacterium]